MHQTLLRLLQQQNSATTILALHAEAAGKAPEAFNYLCSAASDLWQQYDLPSSLDHIDRAISLAEKANRSDPEFVEKMERLLLLRGEVLLEQGRFPESAAYHQDLLTSRVSFLPQSQALDLRPVARGISLRRLGNSLRAMNRLSEALPPLEESVSTLNRTSGEAARKEALLSQMQLGQVLAHLGRSAEGLALCKTQLDTFRVENDGETSHSSTDSTTVYLRLVYARLLVEYGNPLEAIPLLEPLAASNLDRSDPRSAATAFSLLGNAYRRNNRVQDARVAYQRALRLHERSGNLTRLLTVHNNMANLDFAEERYAEAIVQYRQALKIATALGTLNMVPITELNLSLALSRAGRVSEAWQTLERLADRNDLPEVQRFSLESTRFELELFGRSLKSAEQRLQALLALAPDSMDLLTDQLRLRWIQRRNEEEPAATESKSSLQPSGFSEESNRTLFHLLSGHLAASDHDLEEARRQLSLARTSAVPRGAANLQILELVLEATILKAEVDPLSQRKALFFLDQATDLLPTSPPLFSLEHAPRIAAQRAALLESLDPSQAYDAWQSALVGLERWSKAVAQPHQRIFSQAKEVTALEKEIREHLLTSRHAGSTARSIGVIDAELLQTLTEVGKALNSVRHLEEVVNTVLDAAIRLSRAERGFLLLRKVLEGKAQWAIRAARNFERRELTTAEFLVSRSLAERAIAEKTSIVTANAAGDDRFEALSTVHALSLRSVCAVPLILRDEPMGVLYVDHTQHVAAFRETEQALLEALAEQAVMALELGRLRHRLSRNLQNTTSRLRDTIRLMDRQAGPEHEPITRAQLVGTKSAAMQSVLETLDRLRGTKSTVLIHGETGTGKELIARILHRETFPEDRPFIAVNCGALPEQILESELFGHKKGAFSDAIADRKGYFELADQGTLFLDEIGELSPRSQVKLLRVLQEGEVRPVGSEKPVQVRVRVLAATHRDLGDMVRKGEFREDLYYRLNVLQITLPPLRERAEDIPSLVKFFLASAAREHRRKALQVQARAMDALREYTWPGNIREMIHLLQAMTLTASGSSISVEDLPAALRGNRGSGGFSDATPTPLDYDRAKAQFEREFVQNLLRLARGNVAEAARRGRMNRVSLIRLMERHGIKPKRS